MWGGGGGGGGGGGARSASALRGAEITQRGAKITRGKRGFQMLDVRGFAAMALNSDLIFTNAMLDAVPTPLIVTHTAHFCGPGLLACGSIGPKLALAARCE